MDFPQDGFHLGEQVVGRIAAQFLDAGLVEAQAVAQFLRRRAQGGVDVARGEPVDRQGVDEPHRHGLVGRTGEGLLDARFQHLAAVDDRLDVRDGAEGRVLAQGRPVAVVGDQPGPVVGNVLAKQLLHGQATAS